MRDALLIAIVLAGSLAALWRPWLGVLIWTWISIMTPQGLAWGFAMNFPVAAMPAVATLVGLLFSNERRSPFTGPAVTLLAMFMAWMCITFPFSLNVDGSADMLGKALKIDLMILVSLMLLHTRRHIELLAWILVFSIGFFGVKGGFFTLTTGGNYRVWGPGGFIGGNNEMALAIVLVIPLMRFVQLQSKTSWMRHGLSVAMALSAAAAFGSQSRGAVLAIGIMSLYLWLKSSRKGLLGIGIILVGVLLVAFMPENWDHRMNSIADYESDASSMGRINAWWMAWNLAKSHILGGGFAIYSSEVFASYAPNPADVHAAHSIYFQVLGEHGFIGLFLFLAIWWSVWRSASWLIAQGGRDPETIWCKDLGAMCQVSLAGYAVGGAFLSLAYFDLPYDILLLVVVAKRWLKDYMRLKSPAVAARALRGNEMGASVLIAKSQGES